MLLLTRATAAGESKDGIERQMPLAEQLRARTHPLSYRPVFRENGSVVGVAFSGYAGAADNIGYIIPTPVLNNFVQTVDRDGVSKGIHNHNIYTRVLHNLLLR
jgi:hypothetical protein